MLKFRELEKEEVEREKDNVYSTSYVPKKFTKHSAEYGTPKPGTLTEMRAKKACKWIFYDFCNITFRCKSLKINDI